MSAIHIVRGLPEQGPGAFIDRFISASAADPFSTWLILPTRRLVRTARETCAGKNIPIIPTRICTPDDLCFSYFEEHRTTTRLLSKPESKILLSQIIIDHKKELPLFFSGGRPSSGAIENFRDFISVITRRMIAYPDVLGDLSSEKTRQIGIVVNSYKEYLRSHDLADSDTVLDQVARHIRDHPDLRAFGQVFVYGLYEPLPIEQDLIRAVASVADACTVVVPKDPTGSPSKNKAGRWLEESGIPVTTEESAAADLPLAGLFSRNCEKIETKEPVRAATFPTRYAEVAGIAEEICRLHENGVPFSDIAVAFPEVRESAGLVREIFSDFNIPWTTATGIPVSHIPVVEFLTQIPGIPAGQFVREDVIRFIGNPYFVNRKRAPAYPAPGSGAPDIPAAGPDPDPGEADLVSRVAQIDKGLVNWTNGLDRLTKRMLALGEDVDGPGIPVTQDAVERVRDRLLPVLTDLSTLDGRKTLSEHRAAYLNFLSRWGLDRLPCFPDDSLRNEESRGFESFFVCLARLDAMAGILGDRRIETAEFRQILSTLAKETDIYPDGDRAGVSLLGLRECAHQQFPYLFVAGLTEGDMPRLTTRIPFTNTLENARMGTRSLSEILDENRYYFVAALLSATGRLYLSAPLSDGETPLLSSAFLEQVKEKMATVPWGDGDRAPDFSGKAGAVHAGALVAGGEICMALSFLPPDCMIDEITGRINTGRYYRQGAADSVFDGVLSGNEMVSAVLFDRYSPLHVYSPTTLETYTACPFRFFLLRVLGLSVLPDVVTSLSASERGTVIHAVLSTFYRRWMEQGHSRILPSELTDAGTLMAEIASRELAKNTFESPAWEALCIRMLGGKEAGPGIFAQFIDCEIREAESPLEPAYFELAFGMPPKDADDPASVAGPVELSGREGTETIRIKGRIDRIDQTPDGQFVIRDYKTGAKLAGVIEITEGTALQLPLYLLAFEKISGKTGVAAGFCHIRREIENKYVLLDEPGRSLIQSSRPKATPDFREMLLNSHAKAAEAIRQIRAGNFPLPVAEKCPNEYCEYKSVCRFDPARLFRNGEAA
ncbi:MAG TPA: PD-(D/E)XK nuclease family protein [Methanoregula sp.]|nr:PD-(D/E)XK nuclease family protein [Methanoregula sp.]